MRTRPMRWLAVSVTALMLPNTAGWAQPVSLSDEFQLNAYTTGPQRRPNLCMRDEGDFVVAWEDGRADYSGLDHSRDGSETAAIASRFTVNGEPQVSEFVVNSYTTGRQDSASAACLANGDFVVVWSEQKTAFGAAVGRSGVFGRRFRPGGAPAGNEMLIESGESVLGVPEEGSVCSGPDGGFAVVWNSVATSEVTAVRLYDDQGQPVSPQVSLVAGNQPVCCGNDDGFVVAWWRGIGAAGPEVTAQRFSAAGTRVGTEFVVNTYSSARQSTPAIACTATGGFVIVWESYVQIGSSAPQDGDLAGVFAQAFSSDGSRISGEFRVNSYTTGSQRAASVAMDGGGRFVVSWTGTQYDTDGYPVDERIFAQAFDAAASPLGPEFQVNANTSEFASNPTIAAHPAGDFVVAWQTYEDGSEERLAGRRFTLGPGGAFTIDKRDSDGGWGPDQIVSYTITVTAPPEPIDGVVITETVPRKTRFVAASSTAGWQCAPSAEAGSSCTLDIGSLAAGADVTVTFSVRVLAGTNDGWWIFNEATGTRVEPGGATVVEAVGSPAGELTRSSSNEASCLSAPFDCVNFYCRSLADDPICTRFHGVLGSIAASATTLARQILGFASPGRTLLRVRDRVLATTRGGRRLTDLTYEHRTAALDAGKADTAIFAQAAATLGEWADNLEALVAENADGVLVTQADVDGLNALLDALRDGAGGELAAAIERERARVGLDQWAGITSADAFKNLQLLTCEGFEQVLFCAELNGDCVVSASDALIVLRIAVGLQPDRDEADVDGNGSTAATDALRALRIAVGLEPITADCNPG